VLLAACAAGLATPDTRGRPCLNPRWRFVAPHAGSNTGGRRLLFAFHDERPDSHCFYHGFARWCYGDSTRHTEARAAFCTFMEADENWRDYADFSDVAYVGAQYGPAHRAAFMQFMRAHRGVAFADELQHKAFRAMHPDAVLHVWRSVEVPMTPSTLNAALGRLTLAEAHERDARARNPARAVAAHHAALLEHLARRPGGNHYTTVVVVEVASAYALHAPLPAALPIARAPAEGALAAAGRVPTPSLRSRPPTLFVGMYEADARD